MDRKRNLLTSLGLALVGTLLLVGYVRAAEGRAVAGQRLVPVVVLTDDVEAGADDLADKVRVERVPADTRAGGALSSIAAISGRTPTADLFEGEQLLAERLGRSDELPTDLPDGMTALSVALERQRALGGQLAPGTRVDVLATFDDPARTETVLRDVRVLAVDTGRRGSSPVEEVAQLAGSGGGGDVLVTFAVAGGDAERLVHAADSGRLWLVGTAELELSK